MHKIERSVMGFEWKKKIRTFSVVTEKGFEEGFRGLP
jgi:hypothetical protein